jgi:hypothetical protein
MIPKFRITTISATAVGALLILAAPANAQGADAHSLTENGPVTGQISDTANSFGATLLVALPPPLPNL